MKTNELGQKVKTLRNRKGYSQEELAEKTGLSLRTIQRIENGETEPRGDSLKRLAMALEVTPEDIVDWTVREDRGLLVVLNLSTLTSFIFPLLGIIVPLIIWVSKKGKVHNLDKTAKSILNFQITLLLVGFAIFMLTVAGWFTSIKSSVGHAPMLSSSPFGAAGSMGLALFLYLFLSLYEVVLTLVNAARAYKGEDVKYFPAIRFIPN